MAVGDLTRHFGPQLVALLADRLESGASRASLSDCFQRSSFEAVTGELEGRPLMQRVRTIAEALHRSLRAEGEQALLIMRHSLPEPLSADDQVFNDGYWILPLAAYWEERLEATATEWRVGLDALEHLTQRGTAEFAVRRFVAEDPAAMLARLVDWVSHASFHVRRLASEGTRPYLPWAGRLRVQRTQALQFLDAVSPLAFDPSPYVRRSVGNHVRDWRRIDPSVSDAWIAETDPPADVLKLALPKKGR